MTIETIQKFTVPTMEAVNMIRITETCVDCGRKVSMEVTPEDYEKRRQGAMVQDAFPYLSPEEREMFVSRICGICWNKLFGDQ